MRYLILAAALLALAGCNETRDKAVVDSAASAWEAANAAEQGADARLALEAIKAQAYAIIRAMGYDYAPAKGVTK